MKTTKQTTTKMFRQGDILISYVDAIPAGARPATPLLPDRMAVALGEVTGHAHVITEPWMASLYESPDGNGYYATITGDTGLAHDEHSTIPLTPGTVRFKRQREYDMNAFLKERKVKD